MPGSHPLLARMREAGMMAERDDEVSSHVATSSSVEVQIPAVELQFQLQPEEDSISQTSPSSPTRSNRSGGSSPKKRAVRRNKPDDRLAGLASPTGTVSAKQRNAALRRTAGGEESAGQQGWGKLRKAVKKNKKTQKVPVHDLTKTTALTKTTSKTAMTPHFRMGERDQVIVAQEEIKRLEAANAKLRQEAKRLFREEEKGQVATRSRDRAVEGSNALQRKLIQQEAEHSQDRRLWEDQSGKLRNQVAHLEAENHEAEILMQTIVAQLELEKEEHSQDRRLWEEESGKLRSQVAHLEAENHEAKTSMQTIAAQLEVEKEEHSQDRRLWEEESGKLRSTLEVSQRNLSAAREEIELLRAEMLQQREQAARHAAKMAESERVRRVEAAQEARQRDAALEEHILKLASEARGEQLHQDGVKLPQEHQDDGASSYTQPSGPPSPTANTSSAQESEEVHDSYKCPHCHARRFGGSLQHEIQGYRHVLLPRQEQQATHTAAVSGAQQWDRSQQDHDMRQTSPGIYSPQQSAASATPISRGAALTGSPVESRVSSADERQRRAEWVEHLLQLGRGGNGSADAGSTASGGSHAGYGHSDSLTDYSGASSLSSFEERARDAMAERARAREDERAVREHARAEEFRSRQLCAQEREEEANRRRWAMRHGYRTAAFGDVSSAGTDRGRGGTVPSPTHGGIDARAQRSSPPVAEAALSRRDMDASYQLEDRARELEVEGAALRAEAEAEVAAAWASMETSRGQSEAMLHGDAEGRRSRGSSAGAVWSNERFWPDSPPSPVADELRGKLLLLEEERRRSISSAIKTVQHP